MAKAVSKLSGKTVEFIIEKVRDIITKMTGNTSYVTPNPSLADMTTETDKLETDFQNAMDGGKSLKSILRLQKLKVLLMVSLLMAYVQTTSGGDEVVILSSGFAVRKKKQPVGILDPPGKVRVVFGKHPGELIIYWGGVPLRSGYKVQMTADISNPASWADLPNGETGKVRLVVGGLDSGKVYWFRVFTKSTVGYSGPGSEASHMAP